MKRVQRSEKDDELISPKQIPRASHVRSLSYVLQQPENRTQSAHLFPLAPKKQSPSSTHLMDHLQNHPSTKPHIIEKHARLVPLPLPSFRLPPQRNQSFLPQLSEQFDPVAFGEPSGRATGVEMEIERVDSHGDEKRREDGFEQGIGPVVGGTFDDGEANGGRAEEVGEEEEGGEDV